MLFPIFFFIAHFVIFDVFRSPHISNKCTIIIKCNLLHVRIEFCKLFIQRFRFLVNIVSLFDLVWKNITSKTMINCFDNLLSCSIQWVSATLTTISIYKKKQRCVCSMHVIVYMVYTQCEFFIRLVRVVSTPYIDPMKPLCTQME